MSKQYQENLRDNYRDWTLFKRVLAYLKPHGVHVAISVFFLLLVSVLGLAGPYLTKIVIDDHISTSNIEGLNKIALIYLAVLAAAFICQFVQTYLTQYIGQRVMYDLRSQTFAHLQRMPFKFFDKNPIGKLLTRVVNDIEVLKEMLTSGLIFIFKDLFTLGGIFCMMLYLDWQLTLVVCMIFPLLYMATHAYRVRARDALRKNWAHVTHLNSFLEENLSGMPTVQLFNLEQAHSNRFNSINEKKVQEDLRSIHYNSAYLPSMDLFSALGMALVIWYGGGKFVQDQIQLGVLIAFLLYLEKFFEPICELAEKFNIVQTAITCAERTFELLDTPQDVIDPQTPLPVKHIKGNVEFRNMWFAYKKDEYVLKDISFSLNEGESLAVVGATGSGKSSLVNALCRFYDIRRGEILVDGVSIQKMSKFDLRKQISSVQQDVLLFSGNILDNIRLGNPELETTKVESIVQAVHSHHFIDRLPNKYEQKICQYDTTLSLGQKQLLSFARALVVDPRILVLDEATSSIDVETERHIQEATRELIKGRTSIIIAHKLSMVKHVDKVLVLKEGRVAEFGSQQELLQKKGAFWKLYNLQTQNGELIIN